MLSWLYFRSYLIGVVYLPMFLVASLVVYPVCECPSVEEVTPKDMGKIERY